jgi:hypothetical protein
MNSPKLTIQQDKIIVNYSLLYIVTTKCQVLLIVQIDPAIAQVVSYWLLTEVARVQILVRLCGIYGGQMALGQVFS